MALISGGAPAAASAAYSAYSHQITITDTGGECASVGAWDQYSQSCTLNTDITDTTVWITSSGVTLNGNSHLVSSGADVHYGVIIGDDTSGIEVKELNASNFLGSNSLYKGWSGSEAGIYQKPTSTGNVISGNTVTSSDIGIDTPGSASLVSGTTVNNNTVNNNSFYGIRAGGANGETISGNTASSDGYNGIYVYSASNATVSDNIANSDGWYGIYFGSNGGSVSNNTTNSDVYDGILIYGSSNNVVSGNTASLNGNGIYLRYASHDSLFGNVTSSNTGWGLAISRSTYNTVSGNTSSDNGYGIYLDGQHEETSHNNQIYHNNFLSNTTQVYISSTSYVWGNSFNFPAPTGGNYWSNWTSPDANGDGFVDSPFVFYGGQDSLPLTSPVSGAKPPLTLDLPSPAWASLSDYQAGILSVTWTINNTGTAEAWSAQLTGSVNTNGVTLASTLPATIGSGDILPGSSGSVTLKYNVPAGVGSWISTLTGSANDGAGTTYTYP